MNTSNSKMSAEHKAALAEGRTQGAAVRAYLEALEANRPKRGRRRTPESVRKQLDSAIAELDDAGAVRRLELLQTKRDLERELEQMEVTVDMDALEQGFVDVARAYSERKGIEYATWREFGVPASTLKAAGISRSGG